MYKFNRLPADIKKKLSSAELLLSLSEIEKKYQVKLTQALMSIVTGYLKLEDLDEYLISFLGVPQSNCKKIRTELASKILNQLPEPYSGTSSEQEAVEEKIPSISKPGESVLSAEQEIFSAYHGDGANQSLISREEERLKRQVKDNLAKLREEFYFFVQSQKANQAIAALRLLIEKNDLLNFIKEDQKLNQFLSATWEREYGKSLADRFRRNPTEVKFVRLFIKYILQQRLGLSENEAARIGMQLGNIFAAAGQKGYNKMAYFDIKTKNFHWLADE